ncbi:MAG: class I SAM-dependent methyltransferase [Solirubrobacterales bacterium]
MSEPVVRWLEGAIRSDWSILELGSGASSVWFASLGGRLLSLEHDPDWYRSSKADIEAAGVTNADLSLCPRQEFTKRLGELEGDSFELVVVDHLDGEGLDRARSVELVHSLVKPGGYLLLDDSDRPRYGGVDAVLSGWERRRFVGLKGYPPAFAVESTVFRRPQ